MIVKDAKIRLGCADFAPEFTLRATHDSMANWDVQETRNADTWAPDCAQAFKEAVARARRSSTLRGHRIRQEIKRPRNNLGAFGLPCPQSSGL